MSGRGGRGRPTWGEAREGRREPRPRAGGRCRGRQEHRRWRAGRPRSACIEVSGKDSDAGGSGQRRTRRKGSCATSSAARDSRGGKQPIPVVSPQTGVAARATHRPGGGRQSPAPSGAFPGARGGSEDGCCPLASAPSPRPAGPPTGPAPASRRLRAALAASLVLGQGKQPGRPGRAYPAGPP